MYTHKYIHISINVYNNRFYLRSTILLLKSVPQPYEVGTIVLTVQIRTYTETEPQRRQIISPRP